MNRLDRANRRAPWCPALASFAMFAFGSALVPLYDAFCEVTGLGGKIPDQAAFEAPLGVDTTRNVLVATLNGAMPRKFKALQDRIRMHPGEVRTVDFYAENESRNPILGRAVASVAPGEAAKYLTKMVCFCFRDQALGSGEGRVMPVRFFIDPALPKHITTVTLSYTFFRIPEKQIAKLTRGPARDS